MHSILINNQAIFGVYTVKSCLEPVILAMSLYTESQKTQQM